MGEKYTGGPAFPVESSSNFITGMTIRDYFAAKIAGGDAGFESGWSNAVDDIVLEARARLYYRMADAMLNARSE